MQQYFSDEILTINNLTSLSQETLFHIKKVLRGNDGYEFRLVDKNGFIYLCELNNNYALVKEKLEENNELSCDITVILSLIKNDKFDFCLQKLTELGVKRIVPYEAYRSQIKANDKKIDRYEKIVREASEQSHRNLIPKIENFANIKQLKNYLSDINVVAYEKEDFNIKENFNNSKSITIIIGPEGGFAPEEIETIKSLGFNSISLGKRILRAETAAIYLTSIIVEANQ